MKEGRKDWEDQIRRMRTYKEVIKEKEEERSGLNKQERGSA